MCQFRGVGMCVCVSFVVFAGMCVCVSFVVSVCVCVSFVVFKTLAGVG